MGDHRWVVRNRLLKEGQDEVNELVRGENVEQLLKEGALDRLRDLVYNEGCTENEKLAYEEIGHLQLTLPSALMSIIESLLRSEPLVWVSCT